MAVDPAFKGVGKKDGLEIFRIEVSGTVACVPHHVIYKVNAHFLSACLLHTQTLTLHYC